LAIFGCDRRLREVILEGDARRREPARATLGRVVVSPAYHRLHHAPDTQAVNLGVVLTVWDVLARCARFPARGEAVGRTGLDGRPVPVEQAYSARPTPLLMAEQLIEPFRSQS
jgi:hypothetical protein